MNSFELLASLGHLTDTEAAEAASVAMRLPGAARSDLIEWAAWKTSRRIGPPCDFASIGHNVRKALAGSDFRSIPHRPAVEAWIAGGMQGFHDAVEVRRRNRRVSLSPVQRAAAAAALTAMGCKIARNASASDLYDAADRVGLGLDSRNAVPAAPAIFGGAAQSTSVQYSIMARQEIREIAREEIALRLEKPPADKIVIMDRAGVSRSLGDAPTHPEFHKLAAAAAVRDFSGNRLNCLLVGPTGTGKSYACRQLAELMGLPFYFQSIATEPYDLVGYQRVSGEQKYTPFAVAFRDGGVCLLDELDRYDAKALVALNAALANGAMTLDNGEVLRRHADFVCVGAANTFGMGASADFTAAEKLDLSTVSRFSVRLEWGVSRETEDAIIAARADNPAVAAGWLAEIYKARAAMERLGLPYFADQRATETGANLLAAGMEISAVRAITYLAPLDSDQRAAVLNAL